MDTFTLLIISLLLVRWFGLGWMRDSVRFRFLGLSFLVMEPSLCCVELLGADGVMRWSDL